MVNFDRKFGISVCRLTMKSPVESAPLLKPVLKRGALVAAANWQVTLIQATADSLFKLLIATPLIGGLFLVGLVIGAAPEDLLGLEWREMATTIITSLLSHPVVLSAFLASLVVVAAPDELQSLGVREMATTIITSLLSHPVVLTAFLASLVVVAVGGSLFIFLVKAGAVGVLVHGEAKA